jgi:hypothetical protein
VGLTRIVIAPSGHIAWTEDGGVWRLEKDFRAEQLDDADGLDKTSLRVHGTKITWQSNGTARSATLR